MNVESIAWRQSKGVDIVDYAVVTQRAKVDRVGFVSGELAHELPEFVGARDIQATCRDLS